MRLKKIAAGIAGILLIVLLLLFVNGWVGNPLSKILAQNAAEKYIQETYGQLNLEGKEVYYNFKFGVYGVRVYSKTSEDTVFNIYTDSYGRVQYDDYENEVANCFTTYRRLLKELDEKAAELFQNKLAYDFDLVSLRFVRDEHGQELEKLQLDMALDLHNPPVPLEAYVIVYTEEVSYGKIAEIARALEAILREQSVPVVQYSVRLIPLAEKPPKENLAGSWVNSLAVSEFPVELLSEAELPQVMDQFEQNRTQALDQIKERELDKGKGKE